MIRSRQPSSTYSALTSTMCGWVCLQETQSPFYSATWQRLCSLWSGHTYLIHRVPWPLLLSAVQLSKTPIASFLLHPHAWWHWYSALFQICRHNHTHGHYCKKCIYTVRPIQLNPLFLSWVKVSVKQSPELIKNDFSVIQRADRRKAWAKCVAKCFAQGSQPVFYQITITHTN